MGILLLRSKRKNMKRYKRKFDSINLIYEDYKQEKIDSTELCHRLYTISKTKVKIPLKEMSFIKDIVSELNAHSDLASIHRGTWFSKLVEQCKEIYVSYFGMFGEPVKEMSFTNFVHWVIKTRPTPQKEFKKARNSEDFWKLVNEIEKHINKNN